MAQVKDLVLYLQQLRSLLRHGFEPMEFPHAMGPAKKRNKTKQNPLIESPCFLPYISVNVHTCPSPATDQKPLESRDILSILAS